MSQQLTIELDDNTFAALEKLACSAGTTADRLAAFAIERQYGKIVDSETERGSEEKSVGVRPDFERHFGSVDLGHPTGADNEGIDADLAKEYGANPEDA